MENRLQSLGFWIAVSCCLVTGQDMDESSGGLNITTFTLSQTSTQVMTHAVREVGATPSMYCSAVSGYPMKSIAVSRQRTGEIIGMVYEEDIIEITFSPLVCEDTDLYVCTATDEFDSITASMDMSVLCGPELVTTASVNNIDLPYHPFHEDEDFNLGLEIMGYPSPTSMSLTTVNTGLVLASLDFGNNETTGNVIGVGDPGSDVDGNAVNYQFVYEAKNSLYGNAKLVMRGLTNQDSGQIYILVVENDQEPALRYVFVVGEGLLRECLTYISIAIGLAVLLVAVLIGTIILVVTFFCCKPGSPKRQLQAARAALEQVGDHRNSRIEPPRLQTQVSTQSEMNVFVNTAYGVGRDSGNNNTFNTNGGAASPIIQDYTSNRPPAPQKFQPKKRQATKKAPLPPKPDLSRTNSHERSKEFQPTSNLSVPLSALASAGYDPARKDSLVYAVATDDGVYMIPNEGERKASQDQAMQDMYLTSPRNTSMEIEPGDLAKINNGNNPIRPKPRMGSASLPPHNHMYVEPTSLKRKNPQGVRLPLPPPPPPPPVGEEGEVYDYPSPSSPEDVMRAAELKIARAGTEADVIPPIRRKLSLPIEDVQTEYANF